MAEAQQFLSDRRVLAVENDYFTAMDVSRWLTTAGAEVLGPVPTVRRAFAFIEAAGQPDLAVLDVHLGDGELVYPLAARLDALAVPFVFLTNEVHIHTVFKARPCVPKYLGERGLLEALQALTAIAFPPGIARL